MAVSRESMQAYTQQPTFGDMLRRYRRLAGLSQEELAEAAELSPRGLTYLERGQRHPQPATLRRLADALGLAGEERRAFLASAESADQEPAPAGPAVAVPLVGTEGPPTPPSNLPFLLTSFIGRMDELHTISMMLRGRRLLTVTGAGGCGKTRLAIEVAQRLKQHYPDGVWLISLAALSDPALVTDAVARVLNVREEPGEPLLATLAEKLEDKQLLLILDNCEHLRGTCAFLADSLLRRCAGVHVLATSREALGIPGEREWVLSPLALPKAEDEASLQAVNESEAVQLFVERARDRRPDFQVTEETVSDVLTICRRLDGIPLALEDAHARYFQDLAECAEPELIQRGQTVWLDRLESELDNLRAALDWWLQSGHITEELTMASALEVYWGNRGFSTEGVRWLEQGLERGDDVELLTRARALRSQALLLAGLMILDRATEVHEEALALFDRMGDTAGKASAFIDLSQVATMQGNHERATRLAEEGLTFFRQHGDVPRICAALFYLGTSATGQGDLVTARRHLEEALALARTLEGTLYVPSTLLNLGYVALLAGALDEAEELLEEALAVAEGAGQTGQMCYSLANLGEVAMMRGDYRRAAERLDALFALKREGGTGLLSLMILRSVIRLAAETADPERGALLASAEAAVRERAGWPLSGVDREELADVMNRLRADLGVESMGRAWERGRAMSVDEAWACAHEAVTRTLRQPDMERAAGS